jgi:hypothetical protein
MMSICRTERDSRKRVRTGSARTRVAKREPLVLPDGAGRYLPVAEHTLASLRKLLKQNRMIVRSHTKGHRYLTESAVKYSRECVAAIEDELERLKGG